VWRRTDYSESSRVVTVLTRDHGRLQGLAKGAHRPDSPFLGRLDFLNEARATFGADRGGLRLLVALDLLHERRALREPQRFLAASHLAWLSDLAMPHGPEPDIYDLLAGGLALLERCPAAAIPTVVIGLELRHLALLGALPDLHRCGQCGAGLDQGAFLGRNPGLYCARHAAAPRQALGRIGLALLQRLQAAPGREWPNLRQPGDVRLAQSLPAQWLAAATEQRGNLRGLVFAAPVRRA